MSETWNIEFDDGYGSCPMILSYPRDHNSPLKLFILNGIEGSELEFDGASS